MTEPVRWARSNSDADPVLRSVLRYAQSIEPSAAESAAALDAARARVRAELTTSGFRFARVAQSPWLRAGLIAATTSLAWAGAFALHSTSKPPEALAIRAEPPAPRPVPIPTPAVIEPPAPLPSSVPRSRAHPAATRKPLTRDGEVSLLAEAREKLAQDPSETLSLILRHANQFSNSAFAEERAALEIEAFFKLGRQSQALERLKAFEARYPRSAYRRRLQQLSLAAAPGRRDPL